MDIGNSVKELRKSRGMSQVDFAKAIEVTQGYLSKVEQGKTSFSKPTLDIIQQKFGVSFMLSGSQVNELDDNQRVSGYETLRFLKKAHREKQYDDMLEMIKCAKGTDFFKQQRRLIELEMFHAKAVARSAWPKIMTDEDRINVSEALDICLDVIKRFPNPYDSVVTVELYQLCSLFCNCLDEHETGVNYLIKALGVFREDESLDVERNLLADVYNNLTITYLYMKRHDDACKASEMAANTLKEATVSQVNLYGWTLDKQAQCADRVGDVETMEAKFDEALQYFRLIKTVDNEIMVLNNYASGLKRNGKLKEAEGMFTQLVELIRTNPKKAHPLIIAELEKEGYKIFS